MGIGRLCMLFGKTRQAYYKRNDFIEEKQQDEMVALELVAGIRRELPGLGVHKLYWSKESKTPHLYYYFMHMMQHQRHASFQEDVFILYSPRSSFHPKEIYLFLKP
jgi:hypothetical protein